MPGETKAARGELWTQEIISRVRFSVIDISLLSECAFMIFLRIIFEDIPISMCLWWSGSHNLLQYHLLKKEKGTPASNSYIYNAWIRKKIQYIHITWTHLFMFINYI